MEFYIWLLVWLERTVHDSTRKTSQNPSHTYSKIINSQLDIKLEQFTEEELDSE